MKPIYLIDLDGTMYRGKVAMPGGKEFISYLLKEKIRFLFLTNNSMRTPLQNVQHMQALGFEGITREHFFTSAMAASKHIAKTYTQRKAFYIGEDGMKEALLEEGFQICDEHPDFVFIGLSENANYQMYSQAINHVVNGAILIGTNNDRLLAKEQHFACGNGSIVNMVEYATGKESIKIGKPHGIILEEALNYLQEEAQNVTIIGDNLETDMMLGITHQVKTIFVEGGVHSKEDITRLHIHPDKIIKNLYELIVK